MRNRRFLAAFPLLFLLTSRLWAEEISYDRYAPIWTEGPYKKKPPASWEALQSFGKHFLVYPFELLRWPIDETLVFVEDHRLDDKVEWIYEQMKNHGFTPKIRSFFGGGSLGGGFDVEFLKLSNLKEGLPNTTIEGSALWTLDAITDYRLQFLQDEMGGSRFQWGSDVRYENRGEEHFYGIGPDTSLGDGTSYRVERTTLGTELGYGLLDTLQVKGRFSFQNVNLTNGEDGGRGIIDEIFVASRRQTIPGLGGDEILSGIVTLEHDNRDSPDLPTEGGFERFQFSYHKGLDAGSGFFKYRAEAGHFFKVFSERRVFGLRGVLEHNDELGDHTVPFFSMARLGGYGTSPRLGDTHRGYRRDRFYDESLMLLNIEYRWNILEYRDWRVDPVLYGDLGQVFGEWSRFQFDDFKVSYGLGFRISLEHEIVLTLDIARSNEGTEFYVKTRAPF